MAPKPVALDEFSKSKRKKVKAKEGDTHISSILIGQIGKNISAPDNSIKLSHILVEIFGVINQIRKLLGGRLVILECHKDNDSLIEYYLKHGFQHLLPANDDNLVTLHIVVTS